MLMTHHPEANRNNDKVEDKLQIVVHQARKDSQHHVYLQKKVWIVALGTIFRATSYREHRLQKLKQPLQKAYSILSKVKCSRPRHRHHRLRPRRQHHHHHLGCRHRKQRHHRHRHRHRHRHPHRNKKYPIYKDSHQKNRENHRRQHQCPKEENINTKKIYKNDFFQICHPSNNSNKKSLFSTPICLENLKNNKINS